MVMQNFGGQQGVLLGVVTHVASIYANLWERKKAFT